MLQKAMYPIARGLEPVFFLNDDTDHVVTRSGPIKVSHVGVALDITSAMEMMKALSILERTRVPRGASFLSLVEQSPMHMAITGVTIREGLIDHVKPSFLRLADIEVTDNTQAIRMGQCVAISRNCSRSFTRPKPGSKRTLAIMSRFLSRSSP